MCFSRQNPEYSSVRNTILYSTVVVTTQYGRILMKRINEQVDSIATNSQCTVRILKKDAEREIYLYCTVLYRLYRDSEVE